MGEDGTMKCPCKRCRNLNWLSIDDVRFHLFAKGMLEGYTVWTSHGEERGRKRSRTSHNRYCVREPTRVEQPVDLNAMLHDFAGENSEFYNNVDTGTRNVEEVPNDSARKLRVFRGRLSGEGVKELLDGLVFPPPGKTNTKARSIGYGEEHHWTHVPIFYELPYWSSHSLRYSIDIMHTEKNVFENLFFTIVNAKKSKDHKKARANCKHFGVLPHLWIDENGKSPKAPFSITRKQRKLLCEWISSKARADCKHFGVLPHLWIDENGKSPKAPFSITRKQRKLLCEWISSLKLPDGYSSNISRCCNVEECTFYGFKSHDCHIFLQKLLPLAIRELLPAPIADAITAIANFFQDLCSSTVTKTDLEIMEKSVVKALCLLETIFPQSWFDSMEHLVVHLAEEIRLAGPAYWHWMYPIERLLGKLKQKVGNKARVEGSIAKRYMEEEIVNICAFYFASDSIHNKLSRNEVLFDVQKTDKLEVFKYPCDSLGKERSRYLNDDEQLLADEYVLLNSPEVQPYLRRYQDRVMRQRPETTPQQLDHIVKTRFKAWFKKKVEKDEIDGPRFMDLLEGPALKVMTFETCQVDGYKFSTSSASGSGVVVKGTLHENNLDYYGQLIDIVRLIYQGCNHVYLFKCIWFDSLGNGVRIDKNRVVTVDITSRLRSNEVFILASQASQVYYAPSVLDPRSKIYTVVKSKSRPIDESIIVQNDIEDAFQEDRSNAASSFSLFVSPSVKRKKSPLKKKAAVYAEASDTNDFIELNKYSN
nr:PREDICTED: uncharacterized protein LOC108203305 [Daucus carota subsp. sativus]